MYKKIVLGVSMMALSFYANAALNFPINYEGSFVNPETLSQWSVSSREGSPTGEFASYFSTGLTPVVNLEDVEYLLTNNQFEDGEPGSTWLISPEIEITEDTEMFSILLANCGDTNVATYNTFRVLYSLEGTEHADFEANDPLLSGSVRNRGANIISYTSQRAVITNLKGKKIRLAIVNDANTSGFMGFADLVVSPWYFSLDQSDSYDSLLLDSANPVVKMSMTVSTPVTTKGYTAELVTDSGFKTVLNETSKTFNIRNASSINFTFPDKIELQNPQENYTITFTPNFEGAVPAVITGELIAAERKFKAVALVEEVTGTWCGWCTGGIVMMDFWNSYFTGIQDRNKVIEVALHRTDPMSMRSGNYLNDYTTQVKRAGIEVSDPPTVLVNRITGGAPLQFDMKSFFQDLKSPALLKINAVGFDKESKEVCVDYEYTTSFTASNPGFALSAIVTENNVTGYDDAGNWDQSNYYAQYTMAQINNQFDPDIAPFFERFVSPNPDHIPSSMIAYNEVARGIYPSYAGQPLTESVIADTPTKGKFVFTMPDNVNNLENSNVIMVISRRGTNEVMGADIVEAKDYKDMSGVKTVTESGVLFNVMSSDGITSVKTSEDGILTVYSPDGALLYKDAVNAGVNTINVNYTGLAIVTLTTVNGSSSLKTVMK